MKDFLLDSLGDVVISHHDIALVHGMDLLMQKLHQMLSTNNGNGGWTRKREFPCGRS